MEESEHYYLEVSMTGNHFILTQDEKGLWHWKLRGAHQPTRHPIARAGTGYKTQASALKSIQSARRAMSGAFDKKGQPRISNRA